MEANNQKVQTQRVLELIRKNFKTLSEYPGVVAMGAGFLTRNNTLTEDIGIYLEVENESAFEALKQNKSVPETLDDIPIEVQITTEKEPHIRIIKKEDADLAQAYRPLKGGSQITNEIENPPGYISTGTLGCVAYFPQKKSKNDYLGIISNYHVMYANGAKTNHSIYQPSSSYGEVGKIIQGQKLGSEVDWAVAKLADGVEASNEVLGIGEIRAFTDAHVGMRVRKYGNRTHHTVGNITKVGIWNDPEPPYITVYTGLTIINIDSSEKFSDKGDSGAVILNENFDIVGLLWGGAVVDGIKETYANDQRRLHFNEGKFEVPIPKDKQVQHLFSDMSRLKHYQEQMKQNDYSRTILELFLKYIPEITELNNHNRAAIVAWQRNHGPAFIRFIRDNVNKKEHYLIPKTAGDINFTQMFQNMRTIYEEQGSKSLAASFQEFGNEVLQFIEASTTIEEVIQKIVNHDPSISS